MESSSRIHFSQSRNGRLQAHVCGESGHEGQIKAPAIGKDGRAHLYEQKLCVGTVLRMDRAAKVKRKSTNKYRHNLPLVCKDCARMSSSNPGNMAFSDAIASSYFIALCPELMLLRNIVCLSSRRKTRQLAPRD